MAGKAKSPGLEVERSSTVLLILDMLSRFEFPDGLAVARAASKIAPRIAQLRERARKARIPVVFANDNPGRWRSDSAALLRAVSAADSRGRSVIELLRPEESDYLVLKPRHSAFYATPLDVILQSMGAERLILTGVSSHQCVLFTANDAHVRQFELVVPSDCIGAPTASQTKLALSYFRKALSARVTTQARWRP
jgi:nicotinamidase-related amidase